MLHVGVEKGAWRWHFQSLDCFVKSSYVLGSEAWEYILVGCYGEHSNVHQSRSQNDSGDLRGVTGAPEGMVS